jgi:hypothetical protein
VLDLLVERENECVNVWITGRFNNKSWPPNCHTANMLAFYQQSIHEGSELSSTFLNWILFQPVPCNQIYYVTEKSSNIKNKRATWSSTRFRILLSCRCCWAC